MSTHPDIGRLATLIANQPEAVAAATKAGTLADWLYTNWYLAPQEAFAVPAATPPFDALDSGLSEIVDTLSPWTDGWIVLVADVDGRCLAGKGEARRWVAPGRYAGPDRPGLPAMPGDRISMPDHLAWRDTDTGQWAAQSPVPPDGPLVRVYVNVGPDGIGHAVRRIVAWLVDEDIKFRMKCPTSLAGFARVDALVLYLERADWPQLQDAVGSWAEDIAPLVRPGCPALTLSIAPGVGFAEDPGNGRSFGQHRCGLLADVIIKLPQESADVAAQLERAIAAAGIMATQPWRCQ